MQLHEKNWRQSENKWQMWFTWSGEARTRNLWRKKNNWTNFRQENKAIDESSNESDQTFVETKWIMDMLLQVYFVLGQNFSITSSFSLVIFSNTQIKPASHYKHIDFSLTILVSTNKMVYMFKHKREATLSSLPFDKTLERCPQFPCTTSMQPTRVLKVIDHIGSLQPIIAPY